MSLSAAARHLRDYVAIPSVNPMGRVDLDASIVGERRYAERVRDQLAGLEVDAVIVGRGERASVVGVIEVDRASETVLIASHLDTVPVDAMAIEPFDPQIRAGRLYGRGACDTKAGMAALIGALDQVMRHKRLRRNVVIVGEADEEMTSVGVRDVLEHLGERRIDWALVTEPTQLRLVTCHKGRIALRLRADGRACHSSEPANGRNALSLAARAIVALDSLSDELGRAGTGRLGGPTLTLTMMQGGSAPNVVPDRAWMTWDRRTLPGEQAEDVREQIERALALHGVDEHVCIDRLDIGKAALGTADDHACVTRCRQTLRELGLNDEPGVAAFATDAGPLSSRGIPSVVLGPGDIADAHTAAESVDLEQVEAMQRFFERLLA